jgi:hypothetical protein
MIVEEEKTDSIIIIWLMCLYSFFLTRGNARAFNYLCKKKNWSASLVTMLTCWMDVLCLPEGHLHDNRILIFAHSGHSDTSLPRTPPLGALIVAWAYPAVIQELRRLKKEYTSGRAWTLLLSWSCVYSGWLRSHVAQAFRRMASIRG